MWNCFGKRHRTTNTVEGWHNRINHVLGNRHPRVVDLICLLKKEAEKSGNMFMRLELNLEGKKRRKEYLKLDSRIEKTLKKYEETGDIKTCLKTISYIQKLD